MITATQQAEIDAAIAKYRSHRLIEPLFTRLAAELPASLTYHSAHHSEDVFTEVIRFAILDGRTEREVEILALTAAYHDAGFLVRPNDNEKIAADMLELAMTGDGTYSKDEIELARTMILDTQLRDDGSGPHQRPQTELSKYLLDADLSNLGREDFFERFELLIAEMKTERPKEVSKAIALMNAHTWFSSIARQLRQPQKERNCKRLHELLAELHAGEQ